MSVTPNGPPHFPDLVNGLIMSSIRGLRNGIICGVRIRLPYVIQAATYALMYRESAFVERIKFVIKQGISHGRNLGLFVFIYKSICWACRQVGISGGVESWIAGFVGGFIGFGDSKGVSGSVNNQITLYLFARGIEGMIKLAAEKKVIPQSLDTRTEFGFRCFAGFSLALILYMTEYHGNHLQKGFMSTMTNLYYESNSGSFLPPDLYRFSPIIGLVFFSLLGNFFSPDLRLENILARFK